MEESEPLLLLHPQPTQLASEDSEFVPISYIHSPRPLRDLPFLLLFLLSTISTFALGIFAIFHHNPDHSTSCIKTNSFFLHSLPPQFEKNLTLTLVITLLLSLPISFSLLLLLRRFAAQIVYASLPFLLLIPTSLNLYWFIACTLAQSCSSAFPLGYRILLLVFLFLLLALLLYILIANRHRVRLSVQILRVSAAAAAENLSLFAVLSALAIGWVLYCAPVVAFLIFARLNGRVVPVEDKDCRWEQERWVPTYYALAVIVMVWSLAVAVEAQVYVISGTVAQWYFAKEGTKPTRSIRTSLRYIFNPKM